MIWLQAHGVYDLVARYNPGDRAFSEESKKSLGKGSPQETVGFYATLSSTFVAIYRFEQQLYLCLADACLLVTDEVVVDVDGTSDSRKLTVTNKGKDIFEIRYCLDPSNYLEFDPTPFVEREDFDFGLFLSNVLRSESRKRRLLGLDDTE